MECIPKCTEMLQVNQPIRVQPEVKGEGRVGWVLARCSTVKPRWRYSTTCTRDVSNKMHKRLYQFYFGRFLQRKHCSSLQEPAGQIHDAR